MDSIEKKVDIKLVLKEGTRYFINNILLLLLFGLPYIVIIPLFYMTNIIANPYRLFDTPYLIGLIILGFAAMIVYYAYTKVYFILRLASRDGYFKPSDANIAADALKMLPGYIMVDLIAMVITVLGLIMFIVPGIIIGVALSFAGIIYVLNGGVVLSLQESSDLMKGNFWKIIQLFLAMILLNIAAGIVESLFSFLPAVFNALPNLLTNFLNLIMFFWVFSLYKQILIAKSFNPEADRKPAGFFYKYMSIIAIIILAGAFAGIAGAAAFIAPKWMDMAQIQVKQEGKKSTMYIKGVPSNAVEETGFAASKWYVYDGKGKLKSEYAINMMTMDSESREYYASGKLKKTSITKKGKQQGEDVEYDEKGKEIKKQLKIQNLK